MSRSDWNENEFLGESFLGTAIARLYQYGMLNQLPGATVEDGAINVYGDAVRWWEWDDDEQEWWIGREEWWRAGRLGAPWRSLHIPRNHPVLLVAAGEHCLEAACAGKCPGVSPDAMRDYLENHTSVVRRLVADERCEQDGRQ